MKWLLYIVLVICFGVNIMLFFNLQQTNKYLKTNKELIQHLFQYSLLNATTLNNIKIFNIGQSEWVEMDKSDSLSYYIFFSDDHCYPCIENTIKLLKKYNLLDHITFLLGFETKNAYKVFLRDHPEVKYINWVNKIENMSSRPIYFIKNKGQINSIFVSDLQNEPDLTIRFLEELQLFIKSIGI